MPKATMLNGITAAFELIGGGARNAILTPG